MKKGSLMKGAFFYKQFVISTDIRGRHTGW